MAETGAVQLAVVEMVGRLRRLHPRDPELAADRHEVSAARQLEIILDIDLCFPLPESRHGRPWPGEGTL